jgi:hypothetical protein
VITLASDENFDGDIVRGLLRRVPDLDIVRVQDVGLAGSPDPAILALAASDDRILLRHDRDTLPGFVYDRVVAGAPMPGLFLVSNRMPKGRAIEELFWAVHCLEAEDCRDQIKYFRLGRYGSGSGTNQLIHLLNALDGSYLHCGKRLADASPFEAIYFDDQWLPKLEAYFSMSEGAAFIEAVNNEVDP